MLQRGNSGDGCDLASTLCKYDLRKGDLFFLSWARVRRVRRGSISSELLMCGGGVRSILLLPLVARCLETIEVCLWPMGARFTACVGRLAPPLWTRSPLGLVACIAYVFQWRYDGKQPSIGSLGTTSRLSGNQLEDDGSSACVLSLSCIWSSQPS